MHSLLGLAGLLGLISFAFGKRAAEAVAGILIVGAVLFLIWFFTMVELGRI
jgi:hypothetical protein